MIVGSASELMAAVRSNQPECIVIDGLLSGLPTIALRPGQRLESRSPGATLEFRSGTDGLQLSADNQVSGLSISTSLECRALYNDTAQSSLGRIQLRELHLQGQLQLLANDRLRSGHVEIDGLRIDAADTRTREQTVSGNGVQVLQGALTIWNQQSDPDSQLSTRLRGVSIGSLQTPTLGGGVFLSGAQQRDGGRLDIEALEIETVVTDSGLPDGTVDLVSAAVFILGNARAERVRCSRDIETFGANCVALDNWGEVQQWLAEGDVRSFGSSAVAIVNAGALHSLRVAGRVETFGRGARGISIYANTGEVWLGSVTTHGNGAAAIHLTQPVRALTVAGNVTTHGSAGSALVKGVMHTLTADGIAVTEAGETGKLRIMGSIIVHGDGAFALRTKETSDGA